MKTLDNYKFSTKKGFNSTLLKLRYNYLSKYFKGQTCLEMGSADGEGTKILLKHFKRIVAVDGSKRLLDKAKEEINNKNVMFVHSYFENLELYDKFDTVILAHILEHVNDPVSVLKTASKYLNKNGVILVDVPNAMSLHRQVGVLMNLLKSEYDLNTADMSIGHKRVYDMNLLSKDILSAGLKIKNKGGIFLKPFSNAQMENILSKKGIMAFNLMGLRFPDIAAEIYIVATLK